METKAKNPSLKWQRLSAILSVISVVLSIMFFFSKQKQETLGEIVASQAREILHSNILQREHDRRLSVLALQYDSVIHVAERNAFMKDSAIYEAAKKQGIIDNLKIAIENEKPVILDITDDEHLQFFIEWAKP